MKNISRVVSQFKVSQFKVSHEKYLTTVLLNFDRYSDVKKNL